MSTTTATLNAVVRHAGEGEAIWMLNTLTTKKLTTEETAGSFCLLEQLVTADGNPPPHVHLDADEAFYLLEGEIELHVDGDATLVGPGATAFVPRGIAHTFRVLTPSARILVLGSPGGLDHFFAEVGEPAQARTLPVPGAPDVEMVGRVAAAHAIQLLVP